MYQSNMHKQTSNAQVRNNLIIYNQNAYFFWGYDSSLSELWLLHMITKTYTTIDNYTNVNLG